MKCTFVSIWDGSVRLSSDAEYDPDTGAVNVLETHDIDGLNSLDSQFIELPDGTRLDVCRSCNEGVLFSTMDENPVDPDDKTLYENKFCRVCGEEA